MALQEDMRQQGNWLFKYRSYLPLFILVIGLALYILKEFNLNFILGQETTYEFIYNFICLGIGLLGLYIRFHVVGYAAENTSGKNTAEQKADTVNSTGFYSIVRHPLYLGNFLMWLSTAMLIANIWFILVFCLVYWVYYERIMYAEEAYLRDKFGDSYLNWANTVPTFFPRCKNYRKPSLPFNWMKAIKSEKNSFAALTLIFCLFDIIGQIITQRYNFNYVFIGLSVFSLLMYVVIKILKVRKA
ncbi:MAG: isoprenylcysteine carboxylmethyltransferase family protein [Bacteroidales bacterium]|nr:isoprenylcysteine carboxylmethyltransferase family protein [Bacteroidales bacterium]